MGCCASEGDSKRSGDMDAIGKDPSMVWNSKQLQAQDFQIDGANIKLTDAKNKPHRICSRHPFPKNGVFTVKVRYVHRVGLGKFALGVGHFGNKSEDQRIEKMGMKNVARMFVSKREGEIFSGGEVVFQSREWGTEEEDTITMVVNTNSKTIEWRKQNNMETLSQKQSFPHSFNNHGLYFELIVYEPETELNFQAAKDN